MVELQTLLADIRGCRLCAGDMPEAPRPILQAGTGARVLVASQAPGNLARRSGTPFNDPSGERLRDWMGIGRDDFYDADRVAIVPMGFCFPGYDRAGGDLPPMRRCAPTWRTAVLSRLPNLKVTLLIGAYAQKWHLGPEFGRSLTERVAGWRTLADDGIYPTPHPSWRNNAWLKANPWFETDVLPALRTAVRAALEV